MLSCTECGSKIRCGDPFCNCPGSVRVGPNGSMLCSGCIDAAWARYDVVRFFFNRPGYERVIKRNVSLAEARAHCNDPETSSSTARTAAGLNRTRRYGPWFDGYREVRG